MSNVWDHFKRCSREVGGNRQIAKSVLEKDWRWPGRRKRFALMSRSNTTKEIVGSTDKQ
jgi:hypothetical protein